MKDGKLHADGIPSVEYDGLKVYSFNGVRMPEKYGTIHSSKWQSDWILSEKNADMRTQLFRGIGYDRFVSEVGLKPIDRADLYGLPYELLEHQDPTIGRMVFLKMKNPSVPGVYHVEPVAPHSWIRTCEDAMRWRQIGDAAKDKSINIENYFIK
jgi:hypothetical protein